MKESSTVIKAANKKLRSRAGESIAETLVALLISALALVLLAGAITASTRIVRNSRAKLDEYYNKNETVAGMPAGSGTTANVYIKDGDSISSNNIATVPVRCYENDTFSSDKVVAYRINESAPANGGAGD